MEFKSVIDDVGNSSITFLRNGAIFKQEHRFVGSDKMLLDLYATTCSSCGIGFSSPGVMELAVNEVFILTCPCGQRIY